MACYSPLEGYRRIGGGWTPRKQDSAGTRLNVPCGQCIGCRLEYSRQWAIRCMHEAQLHESNAFITLTYADEHLPQDRSLDKREFQLFIKRLRKSIQPQRLRYFHCGEYGAKLGRPHYHACLFGFDFPDKELQRYSKTGEKLYRSDLLDSAWQNKGWALIGEVTFQSAAYVARYITKKITGEAAHDHY